MICSPAMISMPIRSSTNEGEAVGLVTKFDFLKCFALTLSSMVPRYDELMKRTVSDVMIHEFIYVNTTTKLVRVLQLMVEHRLRSIPVMGAGPASGRHHLARGCHASFARLHAWRAACLCNVCKVARQRSYGHSTSLPRLSCAYSGIQ